MSGKICRYEGSMDLLVIEDLQGHPMAYTHSDRLARLYFAAPGMLTVMERMAQLCQRVACSTMDQALKQEAIDTLGEANLALQAAIRTEIDEHSGSEPHVSSTKP